MRFGDAVFNRFDGFVLSLLGPPLESQVLIYTEPSGFARSMFLLVLESVPGLR